MVALNQTAYLAGSIFTAGSDTTARAISVGVLAAACFPKEGELESVAGAGRAPILADQETSLLPLMVRPSFAVYDSIRVLTLRRIGHAHRATNDLGNI